MEIEAKFAVATDTPSPALDTIPGIATCGATEVMRLNAVYYDTAELALSRAKITLRRRTGGHDAGWHIKFPPSKPGAGRLEIHDEITDPASHDIPASLANILLGITRGAACIPVVELANERHQTPLLDEHGNVLAEFCDDHVASRCHLPGGTDLEWREWEFEVTSSTDDPGDTKKLIDAAREVLYSQGAQTSNSASKLQRALGSAPKHAPAPAKAKKVNKRSAALVPLSVIDACRQRIVEAHAPVMMKGEELASLAAALQTLVGVIDVYDDVLDPVPAGQIHEHAADLNAIVRRALRHQAIYEQAATSLEALGVGATDVRATLNPLHRQRERAVEAVQRALTHPRYIEFLHLIDATVREPVLRPGLHNFRDRHAMHRRGSKRLLRMAKALTAMRSHDLEAASARTTTAVPAFDHAVVHAVALAELSRVLRETTKLPTKAVKVHARAAADHARRAEHAFICARIWRQQAAKAQRRGEDTFAYGVLHERCTMQAREHLAAYQRQANLVLEEATALRQQVKAQPKKPRKRFRVKRQGRKA